MWTPLNAQVVLTDVEVNKLIECYSNSRNSSYLKWEPFLENVNHSNDHHSGQSYNATKQSQIQKQIANHVKKHKLGVALAEELHNADGDDRGHLERGIIQHCFKQIGFKLKDHVFKEMMETIRPDRHGNYDYVDLLTQILGKNYKLKYLRGTKRERQTALDKIGHRLNSDSRAKEYVRDIK